MLIRPALESENESHLLSYLCTISTVPEFAQVESVEFDSAHRTNTVVSQPLIGVGGGGEMISVALLIVQFC